MQGCVLLLIAALIAVSIKQHWSNSRALTYAVYYTASLSILLFYGIPFEGKNTVHETKKVSGTEPATMPLQCCGKSKKKIKRFLLKWLKVLNNAFSKEQKFHASCLFAVGRLPMGLCRCLKANVQSLIESRLWRQELVDGISPSPSLGESNSSGTKSSFLKRRMENWRCCCGWRKERRADTWILARKMLKLTEEVDGGTHFLVVKKRRLMPCCEDTCDQIGSTMLVSTLFHKLAQRWNS